MLKDRGFQNVTIEVDEDLATHRAHKRKIEGAGSQSKSWDIIITIKNRYVHS
ncbi:MAG: hypothetical protein ACLRPC_00070 [Streptococcus sp.]